MGMKLTSLLKNVGHKMAGIDQQIECKLCNQINYNITI